MPLTPADVRNKQFSTTRLRPGYDEEEVDAFLDEVEVELDRLIQENEELRSKLAECLRGGKSAVSALSSPLADPEPEMLAPEPMLPEPMEQNLYHLSGAERARLGVEQLPETLGDAIELTAESELVLRTLGEHMFNRYVEIKRQEWDEYRVQVTQWELDRYLSIL